MKAQKEKSNATVDPEEIEWEAWYVVAEHWQSDLQFFNDETRFLRSLVDKYFLRLIEDDNLENTKAMADRLLDLDKERATLHERVTTHLGHLANLVENPFSHDARKVKDEHEALEKEMADFLMDFRNTKQQVFRLTEHVMNSEKARHLLGS